MGLACAKMIQGKLENELLFKRSCERKRIIGNYAKRNHYVALIICVKDEKMVDMLKNSVSKLYSDTFPHGLNIMSFSNTDDIISADLDEYVCNVNRDKRKFSSICHKYTHYFIVSDNENTSLARELAGKILCIDNKAHITEFFIVNCNYNERIDFPALDLWSNELVKRMMTFVAFIYNEEENERVMNSISFYILSCAYDYECDGNKAFDERRFVENANMRERNRLGEERYLERDNYPKYYIMCMEQSSSSEPLARAVTLQVILEDTFTSDIEKLYASEETFRKTLDEAVKKSEASLDKEFTEFKNHSDSIAMKEYRNFKKNNTNRKRGIELLERIFGKFKTTETNSKNTVEIFKDAAIAQIEDIILDINVNTDIRLSSASSVFLRIGDLERCLEALKAIEKVFVEMEREFAGKYEKALNDLNYYLQTCIISANDPNDYYSNAISLAFEYLNKHFSVFKAEKMQDEINRIKDKTVEKYISKIEDINANIILLKNMLLRETQRISENPGPKSLEENLKLYYKESAEKYIINNKAEYIDLLDFATKPSIQPMFFQTFMDKLECFIDEVMKSDDFIRPLSEELYELNLILSHKKTDTSVAALFSEKFFSNKSFMARMSDSALSLIQNGSDVGKYKYHFLFNVSQELFKVINIDSNSVSNIEIYPRHENIYVLSICGPFVKSDFWNFTEVGSESIK